MATSAWRGTPSSTLVPQEIWILAISSASSQFSPATIRMASPAPSIERMVGRAR